VLLAVPLGLVEAAAERGLVVPAGALMLGSLADGERVTIPAGGRFVLAVSEDELNARLAAAAARQRDLPLRDLRVRIGEPIHPGDDDSLVLQRELELTGSVRAIGFTVPVAASLRLTVDNGVLRYEIARATAGPFRLPGALNGVASQLARRQLDPARLAPRYLLEQIELSPGRIVLAGRAR
jgi:hypothetical protein